MGSDLHWSVWLLAGMATGAVPLFGESRLLGILQTLVVVGAPFFIYSSVGIAYLPFVLFYAGLIAVSSFLHKRKTAQEDQDRKDSLEAKKKRWG
jgi:hypothetical protein